MEQALEKAAVKAAKPGFRRKFKYVVNNYSLYLMLLPGLLSLAVFSFAPMFGLYMAFVDYNPQSSIFQSEPVGTLWFQIMFEEPELWMMVRNTLVLSLLKLLIVFSGTILLALLINELNGRIFKRVFQSVSYLPNFISWITVSGMMVILLDGDNGLFNKVIEAFGGTGISWYSDYRQWWGILTLSNLWKNVGWGTIMYLAALTSIDQQLYEAATVDGASRLRQVLHVTLPGISSIISITLILTVGKIFQDDFEQIFALVGDNSTLYETTEVISTRIYRFAVGGMWENYPISTAMGLVQGVISFVLIVVSNKAATRMGYEGVW